ncbi:MAG: hypothetical protein KGD73_00050 [Candidatus Lokiarchaeota archaeon]|nr:hypothetical protein [Candidatus Lokiarchaeota archaeon]
MSFDIFRVDWILVSSVAIILLITFLILVKIYKILTRWRNTLVNEDILLSSQNSVQRTNESIIKACRWNLAINNKLMNKSDPIIIILRTKRRISLLRVVTEGLSSYGLRVINVLLSLSKKSSIDSSKNDINDEIICVINSIMENTSGSANNDKYILISYNDKNFNPIYIKNEKNYLGHIIINSKLNIKEKQENLIENTGFNSTKDSYLIFSEYSIIKFKNKTIEKYRGTQNFHNSIIVRDATRNFKYFETILFGIILKLINKIKS